MPLKLDVKKKLSVRSPRVKSVDIHPTEPWVLASLYTGTVEIYNYHTNQAVKSFDVGEPPIRCGKWITRKQWFVIGSDDFFLRVYNYNTMEKVKVFEAHDDYIRNLAVHPSQNFILSCSDDMLIKMWDWSKNFECVKIWEGHKHYVMSICWNPRDSNVFASGSLDHSIKVWGLGSTKPHYSLEGHERGVNYVDFFPGDKPYLISGSDDNTAKVWDYQNKTCVVVLEGHTNNVSVCMFHPELPIIITGSEDGLVKIWQNNTYRCEKTLNYGMERVWCVSCSKGTNLIALGYDEGLMTIKIGSDAPSMSMHNEKIIFSKHNEIQTVSLKNIEQELTDGEKVNLIPKELGTVEIFPTSISYNPNGRFVAVCGDNEYIIYTSIAWRNKNYGQALELVWAGDSGEYATRESSSKIKIFKNFKEIKTFRPSFGADKIFGGPLLGVKGKDFIVFYDWEKNIVVQRIIDINVKHIFWAENSELLCIATDTGFFIVRYQRELTQQTLINNPPKDDEGIEDAFEMVSEFSERVKGAIWVGDCFIYTNTDHRLNYCVGSEIVTISHLDQNLHLLGYVPSLQRIFLGDKNLNIISYALNLNIANYQTAVLRGNYTVANEILAKIPYENRERIAQFLDAQGLKETALEVSTDEEHKFELAISLKKLDLAFKLATEADSDLKWKQLSDLALSSNQIKLASECLEKAQDYSGLLMIYSSLGNVEGMKKLLIETRLKRKFNISFICAFLLRDLEICLEILIETGRYPEAAFFAQTYAPSHITRIVSLWKKDLTNVSQRAAEALADPTDFPNLFPNRDLALKAEKFFNKFSSLPAQKYPETLQDLNRNLLEEIKSISDDIIINQPNIQNEPEKKTLEPERKKTPEPEREKTPELEKQNESEREKTPELEREKTPEPEREKTPELEKQNESEREKTPELEKQNDSENLEENKEE